MFEIVEINLVTEFSILKVMRVLIGMLFLEFLGDNVWLKKIIN
jgi:hypothetical protein